MATDEEIREGRELLEQCKGSKKEVDITIDENTYYEIYTWYEKFIGKEIPPDDETTFDTVFMAMLKKIRECENKNRK